MSALSWPKRHALTQVLAATFTDAGRAAALASAAGLTLPPQRGFEPLFSRLSGLVLEADRSGKRDELVEAAAGRGADTESLAAFKTPEPPPAPVLESAPDGAAPRPDGVPVSAPPAEGASSWFARRIEWQVGEEIRLRFVRAPGDAVGGAPAGHTPYAGAPFPVELELSATGAEVPERAQTIKVATDEDAEAIFPLVLGEAEAIDLQLRCHSAGFEVGRGRYRLSADGEESGGALAVPDTVLMTVDEDAIKTVRAEPTA